jgi:hypothetical protein
MSRNGGGGKIWKSLRRLQPLQVIRTYGTPRAQIWGTEASPGIDLDTDITGDALDIPLDGLRAWWADMVKQSLLMRLDEVPRWARQNAHPARRSKAARAMSS